MKARFEVRLWDSGSGKPVGEAGAAIVPAPALTPPTTMRCLVLASDGAFFLTAASAFQLDAKSVQIWDAKTLKPLGEPLDVTGHFFHLGPEGKMLLAVSRHEITLWELATRKRICALPSPPEVARAWPSSLDGRRPGWFAAHPNGTGVLRYEGEQVKWWDMSGGKPMEKLALKQAGTVSWVAISHDGKRVATACECPNEVLVWSLETGEPLLRVPELGKVMAMEFSPDGRRLATANSGDVHVWDLEPKK